jgi:hypothetical protein
MRKRPAAVRVAGAVAGCLIAGLASTLIVAWGCAIWAPVTELSPAGVELQRHGDVIAVIDLMVNGVEHVGGWITGPTAGWLPAVGEGTMTTSTRYSAAGAGLFVDEYVVWSVENGSRSGPVARLCRVTAGWPMRVIVCSADTVSPNPLAATAQPVWTGGVLAPRPLRPGKAPFFWADRPVPLQPLWPALLRSTLLYGLFFSVFPLGFSLRAAVRKLRDRCPACSYSRAGLAAGAPCPECGRAEEMKRLPSGAETSAGTDGDASG